MKIEKPANILTFGKQEIIVTIQMASSVLGLVFMDLMIGMSNLRMSTKYGKR